MKKLNYVLLGVLTILFSKCTNEIEIPRSYPTIESMQVSVKEKQSVLFSAKINNEDEYQIIEYGFVWGGDYSTLIYDIGETIKLNGINGDIYSYELKYGTVADQTYKVRGFIKTKNKTIYGNTIEFTSKGSDPTRIIKVEPTIGVVGDTIKIFGENFSEIPEKNWLSIGDLKATVIRSSASLIECIVPEKVGRYGTDGIKLSVYNQTLSSAFEIGKVKINNTYPLTGTYLDEITIEGENFSSNKIYNHVYIGGKRAEIIENDKNKLVIKAPTRIDKKQNSIRIAIEQQSNTFDKYFNVNQPTLNLITGGDIQTGETITINGVNFNPELSYNSINFHGGNRSIPGEIVSGDINHLVVKVPQGPFINREVNINLQIGNIYSTNHFNKKISNNWIMIEKEENTFPIDRLKYSNNAVVVGNQPYISTKYHNSTPNIINMIFGHKYFSWGRTPIENQDILNFPIISSLTDGNNYYAYNFDSDNFRKFNRNSNSWIILENYPGVNRENVTQFTINNEIYMGLGKSNGNYLTDIYKYNPNTNAWTQVTSFPGSSERNNTAVFVINNIAYIVGGATNSSSKDCWAYNSLTNNWHRIADYPYAIDGASAFTLDNEGYVTCGKIVNGSIINEVWKYNPNTNSWIQSESIGNSPRYNHFSFSINNKGYVGGGKTTNEEPIYPTDIYEYIK